MPSSPQELAPQYNYTASQGVRNLEERLAEAEHIVARLHQEIRQLEESVRHWKQSHIAAQEEIIQAKLENG